MILASSAMSFWLPASHWLSAGPAVPFMGSPGSQRPRVSQRSSGLPYQLARVEVLIDAGGARTKNHMPLASTTFQSSLLVALCSPFGLDVDDVEVREK